VPVPERAASRTFSHRGARSPLLMGTLAALMVLETVGLHFLLASRHPIPAAILSLTGVAGLVWIVVDQVALGRGGTSVTPEEIRVHVGRRVAGAIPRGLVASADHHSWRDLPQTSDRLHFNGTKPAPPNVTITLSEPVTLRVLGRVNRPVRRLALCFDDPEAFLAALGTAGEAPIST
jgi:hypothetical protein